MVRTMTGPAATPAAPPAIDLPPDTAGLVAHAVLLPAEPAEWVHVLPRGEIGTRDRRGPYRLDDPAAVIARTEAQAAGKALHLDYDHLSLSASKPGAAPGAGKAAGWISKLETRDDGIWAQVDWTAQAADTLRNREYRYLSPVIAHDKAGRVLWVHSVGLTNTPNLTGLVAINSRLAQQTEPVPMTLEQRLAEALGLPADTAADTLVAHAADLAQAAKAAAPHLAAMRQHLKLGADAGVDAIATAAQALAAPHPGEYVPMASYTALVERTAALETARAGELAAQAVDSATEAGKLTPAERDWALGYARQDPDGFAAHVKGRPVLVSPGIMPAVEPPPDALSEEERLVAMRMGIPEDRFLASRRGEG